MFIRKATKEDLNEMQRIFAFARSEMIKGGNPTQWGDSRPPLFLIEKDINNGVTYVVLNEDKIVATFSFTIGIDETYNNIYEGKWLNNKEYGTIHRIARDNTCKGIFDLVIDFVSKFNVDIRIDTHKDNKPMLHLLEKHNFIKCGIIYIDDGTPRIAFQKLIGK